MNHMMKTTASIKVIPSLARRAWPIALLGMVGVLSLLMATVPEALLERAPDFASLPPLAQKGVLLINPGVLVLVAAITGAALAHRVGLHSVLAGTASSAGWSHTAARAVGYGLGLGLALAAVDAVLSPLLGPAWQALVEASASGAAATFMSMLYGGVAEEVMLRWGVMSLVAWTLTSLLRSQASRLSMHLAIAVAALTFAAGHLPAVAVQLDLTSAIVARTLLLNSLAGLVYGWLFWRHNLEAAMLAHASTHLGLVSWRLLAS